MRFIVTLALSLALATPALGASPAVSRGEQLLAVSFEECIARARNAFTAEGYGIVNYDDTSYVFAGKDIHTAYITCSPAPSNKVWANVFVSSWTQEGKIPGAERVKLQGHMLQGLAAKSFAGTWAVSRDWKTLTLEQQGDQVTGRYFTPPGAVTGTVYGDTLVFSFKDDAGAQKGRAYMRLTSDRTFEGRWCVNECDPKIASQVFNGSRP